MTNLNGGTLFNAEFGIRHGAAPYRKGQVLHSVFAAAEGNQVNLTISIGATCSYKHNSSGFQALLKLADDALFEAKRRGRNQVVFDYAKNDAKSIG